MKRPDIIYLTADDVTDEDTKYIRLDIAIKILEAEPEKIQTSASYRQGYVRATRDKIKLLQELS